MELERKDPVWANWFYRVAICAGLILIVYYTVEFLNKKFLWDLQVYQNAMSRYLAGENPYGLESQWKFVYPPVFLKTLSWAGTFLKPLFMTSYLVTLALMARKSMRPVVMGMALFSLCFFFIARPVTIAIASGNLTFFMHILVILAWMEGGKARHWVFPLLVVVFASLKPYYLAYALVPVMVQGLAPAVLTRTALVVGATAAAWAVQYLASPEEFRQFVEVLRQQAFKGESSMLTGDIGFGFYRYLAPVTGNSLVALVLHSGLSVLCVGAVLRWRRWLAEWGAAHGADVLGFVALIVAILLNPRLKIYDYCFIGSLTAYLVALLWLQRRKFWFILVWLILDYAEKKVGPPLFARFLDAHFLTLVLVILLVQARLAEIRPAPADD